MDFTLLFPFPLFQCSVIRTLIRIRLLLCAPCWKGNILDLRKRFSWNANPQRVTACGNSTKNIVHAAWVHLHEYSVLHDCPVTSLMSPWEGKEIWFMPQRCSPVVPVALEYSTGVHNMQPERLTYTQISCKFVPLYRHPNRNINFNACPSIPAF